MTLLTEKYKNPDRKVKYIDFYYDNYGDIEKAKVNKICLYHLDFSDDLLKLSNGKIKHISFPDELEVEGCFYANFLDSEIKLPNTLLVKHDCILEGSNIKELPNRMNIGHNLNLKHTKITKLPNDLKVGSCLLIAYTKVRELPKGLHYIWTLDIRNTEIINLPEGLKIDHVIKIKGTPLSKKYTDKEIRKMAKNEYLKIIR